MARNQEREGVIAKAPQGKLDEAYIIYQALSKVLTAPSKQGKMEDIDDLEIVLEEYIINDDIAEERIEDPKNITWIQDKLQEIQKKEEKEEHIEGLIETLEKTKDKTKYLRDLEIAKNRYRELEKKAKKRRGIDKGKLYNAVYQYKRMKWKALMGVIRRGKLKPEKDVYLDTPKPND